MNRRGFFGLVFGGLVAKLFPQPINVEHYIQSTIYEFPTDDFQPTLLKFSETYYIPSCDVRKNLSLPKDYVERLNSLCMNPAIITNLEVPKGY